jgi:hypothetical protein
MDESLKAQLQATLEMIPAFTWCAEPFVLSRISPLPKSRLTTSAGTSTFTDLPNGLAIAFGAPVPMLRIHRTIGRTVVFTISGQLDADNVNELCQLVDAEPAGSAREHTLELVATGPCNRRSDEQ